MAIASPDMYTEGEYFENNPTWHVEDSAWKAGNIVEIIEKNRLEVKTVCDVGCGAGEILNQMLAKMPQQIEFHGYEVSPQAFEMSKGKENERLHFYLQDPLSITDRSFDIVMAIDVFEHVEDYMGFLKYLKNIGKQFIFHIPLDISVQSILRGKLNLVRSNVGHIHYFTKESALASLQDCGYEIVDHMYTGTVVELPSQSLLSSLAMYPRKALFALNKDFSVRLLGGYSLLVLAK